MGGHREGNIDKQASHEALPGLDVSFVKENCRRKQTAVKGEPVDGLRVDFYCFGIIDLLKFWNLKAVLEHGIIGRWKKVMGHGQISAQHPPQYAERFKKFVTMSLNPDGGVTPKEPLVKGTKREVFKPDNKICLKFP